MCVDVVWKVKPACCYSIPGHLYYQGDLFCFHVQGSQAKLTHPLHRAAAGCGGTGGACSVPQACLSKGQSIIVQDYTDEMMPSLRTRLHLAVRDAATECTEPVEQGHQGLGAAANRSCDSPARLLMPHAEGRSMENTLCKQRASKTSQQKA